MSEVAGTMRSVIIGRRTGVGRSGTGVRRVRYLDRPATNSGDWTSLYRVSETEMSSYSYTPLGGTTASATSGGQPPTDDWWRW